MASTCLLNWPHRIGLHLFCEGMVIELSEANMVVRTGDPIVARSPEVDPFLREDRAFIDAVQGKENRIRVDYAEALKTHRLTTAAEESARTGQVLRLEPEEVHSVESSL
jgi:predicted dehydrogenase